MRYLGFMLVIAGLLLPAAARANDYPTQARVMYVLECMQENGNQFALVYKCSCALDRIAKKMNYSDFDAGLTIAHYRHMPGDRGGETRDPKKVNAWYKAFTQAQNDAWQACGIPKK
jgi:hypothetical protein